MPNCPDCNTPHAYVGFSSIECRNPNCDHYEVNMEAICPCCGVAGHVPESAESSADSQIAVDVGAPSTTSTPAPSNPINPHFGYTSHGIDYAVGGQAQSSPDSSGGGSGSSSYSDPSGYMSGGDVTISGGSDSGVVTEPIPGL